MFEVLGLTAGESSVYTALVNNPGATVTDLASHAALSVAQASRTADRLVRSGLANRLPGAQPRFIAVAPDIAVEPLITRREDLLRQARQASHELMETFRESSRHAHPAELMEIITGRDNIANRTEQLHDTARTQVRGFDRPPYASQPGEIDQESDRLKQGVTYRVIYTPDAIGWPGRIEGDIRRTCEQGEQARVRPTLPLKLVVIDDRLAVVPVKTGPRVDAALVIHPCDLLDALVALFESEWERAIPLRSYLDGAREASDDNSRPGENAVALLTGLAAGLTDEGIARSLGWSLRTTQRHIQQLMVELNASTRFQAGLEARERGWA